MADPYPALAARFEPLIAAALDRVWQRMRQAGTLAELSEAIQLGGATGVLSFLDSLEEVLRAELAPQLEDAILQSGRALVEILPKGTVGTTFSLTNPNAAQYVRDYTFNLIREISAETREAVRLAVQSSILAGRNPRSIAYDFRASIGLTAPRELTVERFRQALIARDVAYISSLATADKRMIALADHGKLNQKSIDDAVNRLRLRYVQQRSETIARTESMTAVSIGQDQSIRESGLSDRLEKSWAARSGDGRTREEHEIIDEMNGWIPYDQAFITPLGPMMFPRDPDGTAGNVINCRCRLRVRLRDSA